MNAGDASMQAADVDGQRAATLAAAAMDWQQDEGDGNGAGKLRFITPGADQCFALLLRKDTIHLNNTISIS